jgi:CRP/FNR family transcriptional regulator
MWLEFHGQAGANFQMHMLLKEPQSLPVPVACRGCEARCAGICGVMTPAELADLSRYTTRKKVLAGAELQGQGEEVAFFANILKGVVKLSKVMVDGRQQIVGLQFAPDFVGRPFATESSITAEAATDIEICTVSKSALERIIVHNPGLEHRLYDQSLLELDEARDWMLTLGRKSAREKVANFLYFLAVHQDPDVSGASHFELPLTRQDIGDFLGLTIETVSRQMTRLRQDGLIEVVSNRSVTVPDMHRLAIAAGIR